MNIEKRIRELQEAYHELRVAYNGHIRKHHEISKEFNENAFVGRKDFEDDP